MTDKYVLDGTTPRRVADVLEWARWFETADRRVALTEVVGIDGVRRRVSTVFLGIDHGWGRSGRPVLFETMIFADEGVAHEDYQERYATWDEAVAGHARAVAHAEHADAPTAPG